MKQIVITVPVEYDNRTVFESVLSDIFAGKTWGFIGGSGTWNGTIFGEEPQKEPVGESVEDIVASVIENTCIGCSQFYVDVGESACFCEVLMDANDLDIIGYDNDGENEFSDEWEKQQRNILKDMSPEDRRRVSDDLPNIPYGDDDEEEE
jgi:hypothetical protein